MKPLRKLKLSDVAPAEIDASAMGELYAGIDEGIMLLSYGCDYSVCINNSTESRNAPKVHVSPLPAHLVLRDKSMHGLLFIG